MIRTSPFVGVGRAGHFVASTLRAGEMVAIGLEIVSPTDVSALADAARSP